MGKLVPLILELDDELRDGEEMVGVKTELFEENGIKQIGYVAIIRNHKSHNHLDYRYGNLKAHKYTGKDVNNIVL